MRYRNRLVAMLSLLYFNIAIEGGFSRSFLFTPPSRMSLKHHPGFGCRSSNQGLPQRPLRWRIAVACGAVRPTSRSLPGLPPPARRARLCAALALSEWLFFCPGDREFEARTAARLTQQPRSAAGPRMPHTHHASLPTIASLAIERRVRVEIRVRPPKPNHEPAITLMTPAIPSLGAEGCGHPSLTTSRPSRS